MKKTNNSKGISRQRKVNSRNFNLFPIAFFLFSNRYSLIAILIFNIGFRTFNSFAVIDTLRNHNPATSNSKAFINTTNNPSQYACFQPPAPGYINSLVITLGGTSSTGSATVHIFGHEGGSPFPGLERDLITPIVITKTITGNEKITMNLKTPLRIDNNLFFIKVDNFSPNVTLIKDLTTYTPFCSSASGGEYYMQWGKDINGKFTPFLNAFVIDVVMDYTEGLTSPQYFKDITAAAGIDTTLSNNCVSWSDINNDGYLDLLVAARLYKNNGNRTFTDITAKAGLSATWISTFTDMNNDGKDDILFLNGSGANFIYINNGDETFTKNALKLTTPNFVNLSTFTIGDYNNDGYPDLFVGQLWTNDAQGDEIYYPHNLYMNDKNLGFTDTSSLIVPFSVKYLSMDTTIVGINRAVRGAQFVDYNDDGKLDLFVANYRLQPDELWRNNGDGTFTDVSEPLVIDINSKGYSGHGTGCDWADYDNDGDMDLLLPQLAHPRFLMYDHRPTTIYKNNGAPNYSFTDMNPGVNKGIGIDYEETHAGANWGDLNNDGLLDFAISVFYGCRYADVYLQKPDHTFEMKSFAFGLKDVTSAADLALVDFDNDGKLDMAYGVNEGKFRLFNNTADFNYNYVELNLVGTSGNKNAVGAKTTVYAGGEKHTQYQMPYHGAFMSKGNRIHVGLGKANKIDSVVVRWPNGTLNSEKFTGLAINNLNTLTEGGKVTVGNFQTTTFYGVGVKEENGSFSNLTIYPNPASTDLFFNYELATNETVSLTVYSVLGEKITVVNNEKQTSGQHVIQWNIKDEIVSGLYIYRLQAGISQKTGVFVVK